MFLCTLMVVVRKFIYKDEAIKGSHHLYCSLVDEEGPLLDSVEIPSPTAQGTIYFTRNRACAACTVAIIASAWVIVTFIV